MPPWFLALATSATGASTHLYRSSRCPALLYFLIVSLRCLETIQWYSYFSCWSLLVPSVSRGGCTPITCPLRNWRDGCAHVGNSRACSAVYRSCWIASKKSSSLAALLAYLCSCLHFSTLVRATVSATCRNGRHWRTHRCISVPSFGPMGLQLDQPVY